MTIENRVNDLCFAKSAGDGFGIRALGIDCGDSLYGRSAAREQGYDLIAERLMQQLISCPGGPSNTWVMVHKYLGYVTIAFLVIQTIVGVLTYFKRKVVGQRIPGFPDRTHCMLTCVHME